MNNIFDTIIEANSVIEDSKGIRYFLKRLKLKKRLNSYIESIKEFDFSIQLIIDFTEFVTNINLSTNTNGYVNKYIRYSKITDTACNIVFFDEEASLIYNIYIIDGTAKIITYNIITKKNGEEGVFPKDQVDAIVSKDLSAYNDTDMSKTITHIMYDYVNNLIDSMNSFKKER